MNHVLITGACGYVGTRLTHRLLTAGYRVTAVDIMWFGNHLQPHENLTVIQADVRTLGRIQLDGVDSVLHLANVANDPCSDLNPKLSWEINVLATMQLVEASIHSGVEQFIYASSGSVYGVQEAEQVTEDLPLVPISDYNKTKMISERVLLSYAAAIRIHCIRPATVCGVSPRMRLDLSVNMLTMQALVNKRIRVFGGNQIRPNIHIDDMVAVYLHFLTHSAGLDSIYNAGFENMSIMQIAQRAAAKLSADIVVTASTDPRSYRLNSDKLLNTGFHPSRNVEMAMDDIISTYRDGDLHDDAAHYNIRRMKQLGLARQLAEAP